MSRRFWPILADPLAELCGELGVPLGPFRVGLDYKIQW